MIRERLQKLKQRKDQEIQLIRMVTFACETFGWDYYTLMKQPIPFVVGLIDQKEKEAKEMEKKSKKRKGR